MRGFAPAPHKEHCSLTTETRKRDNAKGVRRKTAFCFCGACSWALPTPVKGYSPLKPRKEPRSLTTYYKFFRNYALCVCPHKHSLLLCHVYDSSCPSPAYYATLFLFCKFNLSNFYDKIRTFVRFWKYYSALNLTYIRLFY